MYYKYSKGFCKIMPDLIKKIVIDDFYGGFYGKNSNC